MPNASYPAAAAPTVAEIWNKLIADSFTAASIGQRLKDAAGLDTFVAARVTDISKISSAAIAAGDTANSIAQKLRGMTDNQGVSTFALTNFTATRTQTTVTATSLTNILNKTTGGGIVDFILLEDLDASASTDSIKVNSIDGAAFATFTRDLAADEALDLLLYLADNAVTLSIFTATASGSALRTGYAKYFDTSFQFQMASHTSPVSGVRGTVIYGDPPATWGHKEGKSTEVYEMLLDIPISAKIETVYLMPEIQKYIDPEVDCIRIDEQMDKKRIWFEHAQTQSEIQAGMKAKLEKYLKKDYVYKKDARLKVKHTDGTEDYIAPIIV